MPFPCDTKNKQKNKFLTLANIISELMSVEKKMTKNGAPRNTPSDRKGRASYISRLCEASVSVEASLVMPLAVLALFVLIQIMSMINVTVAVQNSLVNQVVKISGLTYFADIAESALIDELDANDYRAVIDIAENGITSALVKGLVIKDLGPDFFDNGLIEDGERGIRILINPFADSSYCEVILSYSIVPVYDIFKVAKLPIIARAKIKKWSGVTVVPQPSSEENGSDIVYVTEHGNVYHTYSDCPYIRVEVFQTDFSNISSLRNYSGGKYYACSSCINSSAEGKNVYYTKYGDRYHSASSCKKINHNILEINKDDAADKRLCSKCRQRGEK